MNIIKTLKNLYWKNRNSIIVTIHIELNWKYCQNFFVPLSFFNAQNGRKYKQKPRQCIAYLAFGPSIANKKILKLNWKKNFQLVLFSDTIFMFNKYLLKQVEIYSLVRLLQSWSLEWLICGGRISTSSCRVRKKLVMFLKRPDLID